MRWYCLVLILLLAPATALYVPDINLQVQTQNNIVDPGEPVRTEVTLTNQEITQTRYILSVSGQYPHWIVKYNYTGLIEPEDSKVIPITIVPTEPGKYQYNAKLKYEGLVTAEKPIIFTVKEEELPVEERELDISVPASATPGSQLEVSLEAVGFTPQEADIILFRDEQELKRVLVQVDKKQGVIDFTLPDSLVAGEYSITMRTGSIFDSATFTVPEVKKVDKSRTIENSLFGRSITLTIKNSGNSIAEGEISEKILWYERFFTRFEKPPSERGEEVIWEYSINPNQKIEFSYHISFLPLVLFIIIVIMVIAYFAQESTIVSVEKKAVKEDDKIEITLSLKNISDEELEAVKLTDLIPPFSKASFKKEPDAKLRTTEGFVCSWSKKKLAPGEKITVNYTLKTLETIGKIHLPKCQADFLTKDGKAKNAFSLSPYV